MRFVTKSFHLYTYTKFSNYFNQKKIYYNINHIFKGCYAQRFGARGYGHIGMSSLGLMSDIKDTEWQRYIIDIFLFEFQPFIPHIHTYRPKMYCINK